MATIKQIYTFINAVSSMALGTAAVTVANTSDLVALGKIVLSSATNTDLYYQALVDRIGKTYIAYRSLPEKRLGIRKDPLTFGAVLQRVTVKEIAKAKQNDSYDTTNPITETILQDTTKIAQELYSKRGTWDIETKVIYDLQLEGSFASESAYMAFVDMIFKDMYNGMELAIRDCENVTIATMIAAAAQHEGERETAVNILARYNSTFGKTLTAAAAMYDADFLKFAGAKIKQTITRMAEPSARYNVNGWQRWSEAGQLNVHMFEEFASNTGTYLQSDTFHDDLVKLPGYTERTFWQGSGDGSNADRMKVAVKCSENGTDIVDYEVHGVIAAIFDVDTCGVMIDRIRTKSDYKPRYEHTEYYHKADWASYVSLGEQCVIFYIDDYERLFDEPADWTENYATYYVRNALGEYELNASSEYDESKIYYAKIS